MRTKTQFLVNYKIIFLILLFLITLTLIIDSIFINLLRYGTPLTLLLGFVIIILIIFLFINNKEKKNDNINLKLKFISESYLKVIFLFLMSIVVFIPSITGSKSIINWKSVTFLNFIRAFIFILGVSFLPGACLFSIIFKNNDLGQKIQIDSILLKITLYPLISFGYIGIITLLLDRLQFEIDLIRIFLFTSILLLFFIDFVTQKARSNYFFKNAFIETNISIQTYFIFLFSIGIITISIGFQTAWQYLISGDPWDAIKFANVIGNPNIDPTNIWLYPNFWGYTSFGLGILTGLPFINVNTLLCPFAYLFVTSIYIFIKFFLKSQSPKYSILAVFLILIFSSILTEAQVPSMIFVNEFYFIYKSYSYCLFFMAVALFLIKNRADDHPTERKIISLKKKSIKISFLCSFFLLLSFMTYLLPLMVAIVFIFFYCLFSKREHRYNFFFNFLLVSIFFSLLFFSFDLVLDFYLSRVVFIQILNILNISNLKYILVNIPETCFSYSLILILILIVSLFNLFYYHKGKNFRNQKKTVKKNDRNWTIHKIFLIIFVSILIFEYILKILENCNIIENLASKFFIFLLLDNIFLKIGVIGAIGIILSYYCFKINKNYYSILLSWTLISILLGSILTIFEMFNLNSFSLERISEFNLILIKFWYDRIWQFAIIPLSIFASIGLYKLGNKIIRNKIKSKNIQSIFNNLSILIILASSFSGIILRGITDGNANYRYNAEQIDVLNWISENIPINSNIIVGDNFFMGVGTDSITFVSQYFFDEIFEVTFNDANCIEQIGFLRNNTIQYAVISQYFISYFLNRSNFVNNILIPNFYNITLYQNGDLAVYYAPYFN